MEAFRTESTCFGWRPTRIGRDVDSIHFVQSKNNRLIQLAGVPLLFQQSHGIMTEPQAEAAMTRTKQTSEHNRPPAAAPETPADRRVFVLDETRWRELVRALDRPVRKKPRLAKLLAEPSVLD